MGCSLSDLGRGRSQPAFEKLHSAEAGVSSAAVTRVIGLSVFSVTGSHTSNTLESSSLRPGTGAAFRVPLFCGLQLLGLSISCVPWPCSVQAVAVASPACDPGSQLLRNTFSWLCSFCLCGKPTQKPALMAVGFVCSHRKWSTPSCPGLTCFGLKSLLSVEPEHLLSCPE